MATPIKMPQLGLTMTEGTVSKWNKQVGDRVTAGEIIAEIETDKINGEVNAPADGELRAIVAPIGTTIPVTGVIGYIGAPGEMVATDGDAPAPVASTPQEQAPSAPPTAAGPDDGRLKATPIARKLAADLGVDLKSLTGTGPGGRIVESDVRKAAEPQAKAPAPTAVAPTTPIAPAPAGVAQERRPVRERIPLTGMRRTIAQRMYQSLQGSAQLTLGTEVDATAFVRARQDLVADAKGGAPAAGPTYTDMLVKLVARALRDHPYVNATISGDEILVLDEVHVGVAVALETGLIVPNIRNADRLNLPEISDKMRQLTAAARAGKLTVDDVTGATFTITNLGMFDVDFFTPILNPPESAILGVGRIVDKVVPTESGPAIHQLMTLSLTFDHRVFDGAPAARFLQRVKRLIENPLLAL